jgi:hypothetical protein
MPTIIETKVYTISELIATFGKDSKPVEKAMEWGTITEGEWWDSAGTIECAKEMGVMLGIDIDRVYYSGFWSQGDGACFEGTYGYKTGAVKRVKAEFPALTEFHRIAEALQAAQKPYFYKLGARVKHSGRYYHELCTTIEVTHEDEYYEGDWAADHADEEDYIKDTLRDFMRLIYKMLEEDYEYRTSEESVLDMLEANEYTFTEEGTRF